MPYIGNHNDNSLSSFSEGLFNHQPDNWMSLPWTILSQKLFDVCFLQHFARGMVIEQWNPKWIASRSELRESFWLTWVTGSGTLLFARSHVSSTLFNHVWDDEHLCGGPEPLSRLLVTSLLVLYLFCYNLKQHQNLLQTQLLQVSSLSQQNLKLHSTRWGVSVI